MNIQEKRQRLNHIEEIWNNTMGWSKQLFNLYEERKRLKRDIAYYEGKKNGNRARTSRRNEEKPQQRHPVGPTKMW